MPEVMHQAAEKDAAPRSAIWEADAVAHRLRGPGIGETTLLPHGPNRFRAGQYPTVEPPWQPRARRSCALADAPRADGTPILHMRAVQGGLVSSCPVFTARPGDRMTVGAPQGDTALDYVPFDVPVPEAALPPSRLHAETDR